MPSSVVVEFLKIVDFNLRQIQNKRSNKGTAMTTVIEYFKMQLTKGGVITKGGFR